MKRAIGHVRGNAVAYLALFFALGTGGAYAAGQLGPNSVGTAQLKRGSVTSSKVRDGSLQARDFAAGELTAGGFQDAIGKEGPQGPAGDPGIPGDPGTDGTTGAVGAEGAGVASLFGDGSDGDVTIDSDAELDRDMYYESLTLGLGVTLDSGGFRIFVAGTLTLGEGAEIARDGRPGSGLEGGSGLGRARWGARAQEEAAAAPRAEKARGTPSAAMAATARVGQAAGTRSLLRPAREAAECFAAPSGRSGRSLDGNRIRGGAGGGSTGTGAGGGSGGGVAVVAARQIVLSGSTARIAADGGDGGGGGGGGVVAVVSTTPPPAGMTLSAQGGNGGPGSEDGSPGFTTWLQ